MTRDENFVGRTARQVALTVCEISSFQGGIYKDLVFAVLHLQHLVVRETKPPVLFVVRSSIRDPVRLRWEGKQMRLEFAQRHRRADRLAVIHGVQITFLEIHNSLPVRVLDIRVPNIPLFWHESSSKTQVPVGTSKIFSGIRSPIIDSVRRIPSPVILRQMG